MIQNVENKAATVSYNHGSGSGFLIDLDLEPEFSAAPWDIPILSLASQSSRQCPWLRPRLQAWFRQLMAQVNSDRL